MKLREITFSFIGAVLAFMPSLVAAAEPAGNDTPLGQSLARAEASGLSNASITSIIQNLMMWLLGILGFIAIIGFLIAGYMYLTAAGDEGQIERAKEATKWSVVGVVVAMIGFIILVAANQFLLANNAEF